MSHTGDPAPSGPMYESYLLINNIGKRQNWGSLLRSATAFGVTEVIVVGEKKLATFGNQGTVSHIKFRRFDKLDEAVQWCHNKQPFVHVCGIEIDDTSESIIQSQPHRSGETHSEKSRISTYPFRGSTCFMLGNEGIGMTEKQKKACDHFVYIPQIGSATASLNVAIAGSIVLHHFAVWANMQEQQREGQKFVVVEPRSKLDKFTNPTEDEAAEQQEKSHERAMRKLQEVDMEGTGGLFGDGEDQ
eukprot:GDKI01003588.1.p1 GENE.GDKI01003588.1~~GDKI01003588.1.p1  ORF type:complete len:245 (+),score=57.77 GDKI01003588.1:84-818(+)